MFYETTNQLIANNIIFTNSTLYSKKSQTTTSSFQGSIYDKHATCTSICLWAYNIEMFPYIFNLVCILDEKLV